MAFACYKFSVMEENELKMEDLNQAFLAVLFVFVIQILLIIFIGIIIFDLDNSAIVKIELPTTLTCLGARFICSILMHLQVEGDVRQGLKIMKYVTNH